MIIFMIFQTSFQANPSISLQIDPSKNKLV